MDYASDTATKLGRIDRTLAFCSARIPLFTARTHRLAYRISGRRVGGRLPGYHIGWLTTTGRTTGKARTWPLLYFTDGDDFVVLASNNGADTHPQWYLNLLRHPDATFEVDRRRIGVTAVPAGPGERARLWPIALHAFPLYEAVVKRTTREIPIVILHPSRPTTGTAA